jgi:polar amino acid transport system substrate-binding protein
MMELAASGRLRIGVAYAPSATPLFVVRDATGAPHGVTVDLGRALAQRLGVAAEFVVAPNTNELTEAIAIGAIDVTFMPVDEERKKYVDFGPAYFIIEATYLVGPASPIRSIADVDRPDVTIVGVANSTTIRGAARVTKTARIVGAKSIDEAMSMMRAGAAQAFALTHDSLPPLQKALPGSRILDGAFHTTGVAVAVAKNRPAALAYVSTFLDEAKTNGTARRALDDAGLKNLPVAPN